MQSGMKLTSSRASSRRPKISSESRNVPQITRQIATQTPSQLQVPIKGLGRRGGSVLQQELHDVDRVQGRALAQDVEDAHERGPVPREPVRPHPADQHVVDAL